jgi:hypothetical protein
MAAVAGADHQAHAVRLVSPPHLPFWDAPIISTKLPCERRIPTQPLNDTNYRQLSVRKSISDLVAARTRMLRMTAEMRGRHIRETLGQVIL